MTIRLYQHITWHPVWLHDVPLIVLAHLSLPSLPFPLSGCMGKAMQLERKKSPMDQRHGRLSILENNHVPCASRDPHNPDPVVAMIYLGLKAEPVPPALQPCEGAVGCKPAASPTDTLLQVTFSSKWLALGASLTWQSHFAGLQQPLHSFTIK